MSIKLNGHCNPYSKGDYHVGYSALIQGLVIGAFPCGVIYSFLDLYELSFRFQALIIYVILPVSCYLSYRYYKSEGRGIVLL